MDMSHGLLESAESPRSKKPGEKVVFLSIRGMARKTYIQKPGSLTVFSFSQNEHAWFVCTDLPTFCVMTLK